MCLSAHQVQEMSANNPLVPNPTPSMVLVFTARVGKAKAFNIPWADPGVRLVCGSFRVPSFFIIEKSLTGSLSFLIHSAVVSAAHILSFVL